MSRSEESGRTGHSIVRALEAKRMLREQQQVDHALTQQPALPVITRPAHKGIGARGAK
jgi:hypothetical protein